MSTSRRDLPPFQYDCSAGHEIGADRPVDRCPMVVKGSPCDGQLTRFGPGSQTGSK